MQSRLTNIASHSATAAAVLAIGLLISAAGFHWAANQLERDAKAKFESVVDDAEDGIKQRVQAYADVLHAVRGLFSASDSVSREAFRRYVSSLNLVHRYPGIQLVAFNRRVPFERRRDYEAAVRRDTSVDPKGYPNFAIKPPGDRPEYFVAEYLEPMTGNEEALGLDAGGDRVRAASVEHARDSGELAASGRVILVRGDARHVGFTLRLPLYRNGMPQQTVEQRRQAFVGSIVSSYRMNNVMQGALNEQLLRQLHIRIHDAGFSSSAAPPDAPTAENLLFDNGPLRNSASAQPGPSLANDENASFSRTLTLDVGGRRWNMYFTARQGFATPFERWQPLAVLLGGISVTLLLFGLIRSLATSGSRAVTLAESITEDLRRSETKLAKAQRQTQELIEALPNPIYFKSTDGRYLGVNRAWEKFFGVSRNTFIGKTVADLYPNDPEIAKRLQADDQALWDHPGTKVYETSITTPDGQHHDVIYYKATFTHTDGSVAGLIGTIVDISERKRSEAAAKASEERFRATFDQAAVGIVHTSYEGKYLLVNQKFCDMLGYREYELVGRAAADFTHPDDRETSRQKRQLIWDGKLDGYTEEKRYLRKDGTVIWTNRTVSLARDASGKPLYFIRVIEDVTQRKEAEERYRATFENAPVGIMHTAIDGYRILRANRKLCEMLGYTRDELLGMTSTDIVHPDYRFSDRISYRQPILNDERQSFASERKFVRKDGSSFWVNRTVSLVRNASGEPLYFIRIVEDIDERKQAEAALRNSEVRYRSVIAAIAEGVVLRDKDARIVTCNASAERILGKTLEQMRGSMFYDSSWQAIREDGTPFPLDERPIHIALRAGQLQSNVVQGLRKLDGTVLWLSMNVQPLFDESDTTLTGVVSTLTDITERKQAELRQTMEHAITRILADADASEDAMPRIIRTICVTMGWHCGARWVWDKEAVLLRCREMWGIDTPEIREFIAASANGTISPEPAGQGLVRRTYASGQPIWISDVTQVKGLLKRASMVTKAGLHGAFGFPLRLGGEVLGVMEFFHRDVREPDALLLKIAESIGNQIGQFMARKQAEERIRHLANYDELTGLPNRSMFQERLHHALAQAHRHARPLAVLFIDLDRFKDINDTLGHEAGDHVLKDVAERLRGCLRDSDTVGRLGGDEFVVLIEGLPQLADVAAVAKKILEAVARPFMLAAKEFHIGASIGISAFPEDGKDLQTLLKHADAAMYRAKEQGRNNYQFHSPPG